MRLVLVGVAAVVVWGQRGDTVHVHVLLKSNVFHYIAIQEPDDFWSGISTYS